MEKYNNVRNINRWGSKKPKEAVREVVSTIPINMGPRF